MIVNINEGVYSRSLQMWNRNNISDYAQPTINTISISSEIINNSLLNLSNIHIVQNDNIASLQDQLQLQPKQKPFNNNEHNSKKKKKKKKKKKLNVSNVSDVSNVVINNNPVSGLINNNNPESDDEDTTDTEEILISEKKDYKVETVKDKRKIIEIVNKTNNRNNKMAKVLVEDDDEDDDMNDISDKMSVHSRRVINKGVSGMDITSVNSIRTANLSVFSAKMRE
jgi:hypothetical protein